jgi:hypothetical protein
MGNSQGRSIDDMFNAFLFGNDSWQAQGKNVRTTSPGDSSQPIIDPVATKIDKENASRDASVPSTVAEAVVYPSQSIPIATAVPMSAPAPDYPEKGGISRRTPDSRS